MLVLHGLCSGTKVGRPNADRVTRVDFLVIRLPLLRINATDITITRYPSFPTFRLFTSARVRLTYFLVAMNFLVRRW